MGTGFPQPKKSMGTPFPIVPTGNEPCVRMTILSQLFGVNRSAIPDDMQNHFEY
jgi:hypothetical protein